MAQEVEIERLVTRLVGDASSYLKMCQDAAHKTAELRASAAQTKQTENLLADAHRELANAQAMVNQRMEAGISAAKTYGNSMQSLGGFLTVAGGAFTALSGGMALKGLMSAGAFEQTNIAFETMMGNVEETKKLLASLTDFAAKTPFEMPEIEQAARGLVQFGERGDQLMDTLNLLGNAAAGTSTPFGMVALVFNQVRGVGKLLTQDFRQLSTRGIISLVDIAKHFKVTEQAAQRMLSEGKISFEDLRSILRELSSEGGRFANLMGRQSESLLGRWSTLKDAFNIVMRQLGEQLLPAAKYAVEGFVKLTEVFGSLGTTSKTFLAYALALTAALGSLLTAVGLAMFAFAKWGGILTTILGVMSAKNAVTLLATLYYYGYAAALRVVAAAQWAALHSALLLKVALGVGLVVAAGALIYWLAGGAKATEELNEATQKLRSSSSQMLGVERDRTQNIIGKGRTMQGPERARHLDEEIKYAQKQLEDANKAKEFAEKKAESSRTNLSWVRWGKAAEHQVDLAVVKQEEDSVKALRDRVKELTEERKKLSAVKLSEEALTDLREYDAKLREQIATFGMARHEADLYKLAQKGVSEAEVSPVRARAQQLEQLERQKKAEEEYTSKVTKKISELRNEIAVFNLSAGAKAAHRAAQDGATVADQRSIQVMTEKLAKMEEEKQKRESLTKSLADYNKTLQEQIDTFGMSSQAVEIYKLKQQGASEQEVAAARRRGQQLQTLQKAQKLIEEGKQLTEKYKSPSQKFAEDKANLNTLLKSGAINIGTYNKALQEAEQQAHKDYTANFKVSGVGGLVAGTAEAAKAIEEYRLGAMQVPASQTRVRPGGNPQSQLDMPISPALTNALKNRDEDSGLMVQYLRELADLARSSYQSGGGITTQPSTIGS